MGGIVGGALALGGAILGGNAQKSAAQTAANATTQAADAAAAAQLHMYDTTRADQAPWRAAGENALTKMTGFQTPSAFSFTGQDYLANQDPGYGFQMSEGLKALDKTAAARGGLLSGGALKGALGYSQGLASQDYQNAYNRALTGYNANQNAQNTQFNRLASVAGLGQTANNQVQTAGQNSANNLSNIYSTQGANLGNAALASGNATASMYRGIGNQLGGVNWGNVGNSLGLSSGFGSGYNSNTGVGNTSVNWGY